MTENQSIEERLDDGLKIEQPAAVSAEEAPNKVEYETDFVKTMVKNKDKKLFERVKKADLYKRNFDELTTSATSSKLEEYVKQIDSNEKKMKELFEGKKTLWDTIVIYWARITGREYTEKERLIDAMVRNAENAVSDLGSKLSNFITTKEQLNQYYIEKKEMKAELSDSIDDYKGIISQLDAEIMKYQHDYDKLETKGELSMRDTLEMEIDKMAKDKRTVERQLEIASNKYIFMDNTSLVLDALSNQVETAVDRVVIMKSKAEDYITEAKQMKDSIVKLSGIIKSTTEMQKYSAQIQNALNQGLSLLSQNLDIIVKSIGSEEPNLYKENTINGISARSQKGQEIVYEGTDDLSTKINDIRARPGKYSSKQNN